MSRQRKRSSETTFSRKLMATAYHEAGHAVVGYDLRQRLRKVSIIPNETSAGRCAFAGFGPKFNPEADVSWRVRTRLERSIIVSLAGPEAERVFRGRRNNVGAAGDFSDAVDYASYLVSTDEELETYVAWLQVRAKLAVENEIAWARISGLVEALLTSRELTARRAREIIKTATPRF